MSDLGKMIRQRRKQLGMTQKELAKRANVSQQMITALETGRIKRTASTPELFRALDLDINKALSDNPEIKGLTAYPLVSENDFESILSIIKVTLSDYHASHLDNGEPFIVNSLNIDEVTSAIGDKLVKQFHIETQ